MLEYLRDQGWLKLPSVRNSGPRGPRQIQLSEASAPQARVEGSAGEFEPLVFEIVEDRKTGQLWTELIERHHYLRYRVPVGANLRYLVRFGQSRRICARLLVVVLTRLEDGGTRSMDRLERGATSSAICS